MDVEGREAVAPPQVQDPAPWLVSELQLLCSAGKPPAAPQQA